MSSWRFLDVPGKPSREIRQGCPLQAWSLAFKVCRLLWMGSMHMQSLYLTKWQNFPFQDRKDQHRWVVCRRFSRWMIASHVLLPWNPHASGVCVGIWATNRGKTDHMTWCDSHVVSNYHGKPADKYPLFLTDSEMGWQMTCASLQSLHIMELYSPWQVWSAAGGGRGLKLQEGWVTISGVLNAALLKPRIILMDPWKMCPQ